jgi:hypothetical protein
MAFGRVVVHHGDVAHDFHAGCAHGQQQHAVAVVLVGCAVRIGIARHHDQQLAVRMRHASDEPLAAVEHQVVALAPHRGLQIGRVGRGHVGLRHRKRRADLAVQRRQQPLRALCRCGEAVQQLHVAGVGRAAVEHLGRPGQAPHGLGQRRIVQIGKARARLVVTQPGQEQVPQTFLARQRFQVFQEWRRIDAVLHRLVPGRVVGQHIALHEIAQTLLQGLGLGAVFEVHAAFWTAAGMPACTPGTAGRDCRPGLTCIKSVASLAASAARRSQRVAYS